MQKKNQIDRVKNERLRDLWLIGLLLLFTWPLFLLGWLLSRNKNK
jgi:hypothetical protein